MSAAKTEPKVKKTSQSTVKKTTSSQESTATSQKTSTQSQKTSQKNNTQSGKKASSKSRSKSSKTRAKKPPQPNLSDLFPEIELPPVSGSMRFLQSQILNYLQPTFLKIKTSLLAFAFIWLALFVVLIIFWWFLGYYLPSLQPPPYQDIQIWT